jgi:hypothetical protein
MLFYDTQARNIALSIDISTKKTDFDKFGALELFMLSIETFANRGPSLKSERIIPSK